MGTEEKPKSLNKSCILLIVIGGMERFAFKGVACNLVTCLTDMVKMSTSSAAKTVNTWCGITSMLPLLIAPIADAYWDQYSTIIASSSIYAMGLMALTWTALGKAWAHSNTLASSTSALFWSLSLISLGQGGYNPSLQAFGADQMEIEDQYSLHCTNINKVDEEKSSTQKSLFFQWWYFGICTGSLMGVSLMSYIQDNFGWGLGFAIPTFAMIASIAFFSSRSQHYSYKQCKDGESSRFGVAIWAAKAKLSKIMRGRITLSSMKSDIIELEEKPLCHQNAEGQEAIAGTNLSKTTVHLPKNIKVIIRLFPIWTMLLMFAVIFQLPNTFFIKQGASMNRSIGIGNFKIPPATLQTSITISIILLMPLYDTILVPIVRVFTRSEKGISVRQRMGIGMLLSITAMAIAAVVEAKRREMGGEKMSIFCLLPQYVLLGVSDVFTVVGMQEFFYGEVPEGMRTMGIAMYTSVFGVGSFLGALLISAVEMFTGSANGNGGGWFSDDMSVARLDKYYWLLTGGSSVSLMVFVILCRFHRSRE